MTTPHPTTATTPSRDRRIEALRKAAQDKRVRAIQRAEAGIRQLIKNGEEINFRTVARAANVSLDFLYTNTELRRRIEKLRGQQTMQQQPSTAPTDMDGNIAHVLTAKLRDERATRRTAVHDLEQRLAAAHGELLRLRRILQQHNIEA